MRFIGGKCTDWLGLSDAGGGIGTYQCDDLREAPEREEDCEHHLAGLSSAFTLDLVQMDWLC